MVSPAVLLTFALGLVPSLTVASPCGDNVAIERLPVFSSSDGPFIIRAQDGFNVFLKHDEKLGAYVPVISTNDDDPPEFLLADGNLTTADKSLAAIYLPPKDSLFPLVFSKEAEGKDGAETVFVTKTRSDGSGREIRRIWFLNGRELMTCNSFPLEEGKPDGMKIEADLGFE